MKSATILVAVLAGTLLAACGSSAPAGHVTPAATPSPSASLSADCAKLAAAAIPLAAYDSLVIAELDRVARGGGTASRADIRAARAAVAALVATGCPQFSYLAKQDAAS